VPKARGDSYFSGYTYCPRTEVLLPVTLLQWGSRKGFDTSSEHTSRRIIHPCIITSTTISTYTTAASLYNNIIEDPDFSREIITDHLLTIISRSRQTMAEIRDPFHMASNTLIIRMNVFKARY